MGDRYSGFEARREQRQAVSTLPGLHAYLSYDDPAGALEWMARVGFTVVARLDAPDGLVAHAEVRYGDVVLMVASADAEYDTPRLVGRSVGSGLYVAVNEPADVDAWYERAVAAGAKKVFAPEDTEWGTRRARVLDPAGYEWSVGTYRPGSVL